MPSIHQLVAGFRLGDAISSEALSLQKVFLGWDCSSSIFTESKRVAPEATRFVRDVRECPECVGPDDIVILHLSIGSPVNDVFADLRCRKMLLYHNITPPHYFLAVNSQTASDLERGRKQLENLRNAADVNVADSAFNAQELRDAGYPMPHVLPLLTDFERLAEPPDKAILKAFGDGITNILFVGRGAPNKRIEDLLQVFFHYQSSINPNSRLLHVGSFHGTERYRGIVEQSTRELGLRNVYFAGPISQARLIAYYQRAHVFLCMSEHEGFCLPLLESMFFNVPTIAYAAGAVPETMGEAGVLLREKNFPLIAEVIHRIIVDKKLKESLIRRQKERIQTYRNRNLESELRALLSPLLK